MNPEFRRQLWLQFSATRLALLPLLLAASFCAVYLTVPTPPALPLASVGAALFGLLVLGMGTLAAGSSVMDEITDHTWDQQRMSAMQPWAMTWGKLAGATAYGWYGGALCLLVAVPSALVLESSAFVLKVTVTAVLTGVFLQALLVAVNLQLLKTGSRVSRRGGAWVLLLVLLWGGAIAMATLRGERITWWGQFMDRLDLALASVVLFALCALVAAWRSMAEVLAVRQLPWGWPALALAATVYLTGFARSHAMSVLGVVGLSICAVLTYMALLTEPQQRPLWQRVVNRARTGQWRAVLLQLPRWPTTLLLALPFAVLTTLALDPFAAVPWTLADALLLQPLAVVLLLARDCALALYFSFAPKGRRPLMAFAVLMFVLYGLLPWLLRATDSQWLPGLALPVLAGGGLSLVFATVHLGLALGLLRQRWLATGP
ncbi:MAG: hypothetical protein V4858_12440 [Pseudomonadota bacterium]